VHSEILEKNRSARLKVFVVWLPMLPGDSRQMIDQRVLADPRVTYYWDPKARMGEWFSSHVTHQPGTTWDAFFMYGQQARWNSVPGPLVGSGSSVMGSSGDLLAAFERVRAASSSGPASA